MTTITCDICKKEIDEHDVYVWHRRCLHDEPLHLDLCGDCDGAVQEFVTNWVPMVNN